MGADPYTARMKIVLICVGKLKSGWATDACEDYASRLKRSMKFEIVELPASKETDANRQREDESRRLLAAADKYDGQRFILDERGDAYSSASFAKLLRGAGDRGDTLVFLLGGAYGHTDAVRTSGRTLRLTDMTLPHELCRVVFLEQVYRAGEIIRGSGYHH